MLCQYAGVKLNKQFNSSNVNNIKQVESGNKYTS